MRTKRADPSAAARALRCCRREELRIEWGAGGSTLVKTAEVGKAIYKRTYQSDLLRSSAKGRPQIRNFVACPGEAPTSGVK